MKSAFITGGTGFIGKKLIYSLLKNTKIQKIYVLVRDNDTSIQKLSKSVNYAKESNKELIFIEGDVKEDSLGLSNENKKLILDCQEVYHLASNVSLSSNPNDKEEIYNCNFNGTKNLLELLKKSPSLETIYIFSTAYASGKTRGCMVEDWFFKPSSFRNHYEESKWLTEKLAQEYINLHSLPIVILRPSIVAAEKKDDFNQVKNQTFYYYSKILRRASKINSEDKEIRIIGDINSTSNIILVNDVIDLLLEIRKQPQKKKIYNLANVNNILVEEYLTILKELINTESNFSLKESIDEKTITDAEKYIYQRTKPYFDYNSIVDLSWEYKNTEVERNKFNLGKTNLSWIQNHLLEFFEYLDNEQKK